MSSPTEVQVITEIDVYEASVRKVVSNGNLNASPLAEPSYSWSDVETEEPKAEEPKAEEPKAEKPKVEEEPQLTESANERLDKLMAAISDIVHSDNIKVDVELESDEDMSEIDDMPKLVDDTDSDMPELISESDSDDEMPGLVEKSDSENDVEDDLMVAVFKRPSCPRCEAALKVLLAHEENNEEEELEEDLEEEHTYDEDTSNSDTSDTETSSESDDDSDSDYVPSESESESPRTVRQLRRWNAKTERAPESTACLPPVIQFIAIVLFVVHILKFLLNEPSQRIRCYS